MKLLLTFGLICTFALCQADLLTPVNPQDGIYQAPRIFYGYVAQARQFPHMCSLLNRKTTGSYTLCGGSLISQKHILTAAHCVNSVVSTTVGCGTVERNKPYLQVVSSKFIAHPQYNPTTLNNDIAIWTLPITITYDAYVKAIRLPTVAQATVSFNGVMTTVSGFGRYSVSVSSSSQILRYVNLRVISNADCAVNYGSHVIVDSSICALGYEFDEQSTCSGDSGSPMIIQEGSENTQIGVTSFVSSKGCGSDRPTGFVRTASFLFWINEVTGIPVRYS
ncbi:collagenase-like [Culicoides brevitarsis]|uniref:collagenase-like n=1 Tax=Culicoides brevitarsis TaxID=469753 RepID=UPI00307B7B83